MSGQDMDPNAFWLRWKSYVVAMSSVLAMVTLGTLWFLNGQDGDAQNGHVKNAQLSEDVMEALEAVDEAVPDGYIFPQLQSFPNWVEIENKQNKNNKDERIPF